MHMRMLMNVGIMGSIVNNFVIGKARTLRGFSQTQQLSFIVKKQKLKKFLNLKKTRINQRKKNLKKARFSKYILPT